MIRRLWMAHLLLLLMAGAAYAQDLGPKNGRDLPGADTNRVVVGTRVPDFTLLDAADAKHTLSQFRGEQVVLVFFRGSW